MQNIDTPMWKKFNLSELFESSNGDTDIQKIHINGKGFPVVSAGETDIGIIGKTDIAAKVFSSNTITVDMFGNVYFRDFEYKMATHARVFSLSLKDKHLTKEVGLYIAATMAKYKNMFSFNNMCSWNKIKDLTILLPVKENEEIDFEYMEERIKELEAERIKELEAALRVMELHDTKLTKDEEKALYSSPTLKEFRVGDLFDLQGVRQAKSQKDIPNDVNGIPYVVQSQFNNMVTRTVNEQYLINHDEPVCDGNCIVLGVTLPAISYQPQKFGASQVITARANFLNEEVGQYFVMLFKKLSQQFSYQNKPGLQKYKDMMVMLPVDSCGEPDFVYMKNYIRAIEKQTIRKLYDDKGIFIDKAKEVCD